MAEDKARSRQYDYHLNSNLVIDKRKGRRGGAREPSGEAVRAPVDPKRMGDRAGHASAAGSRRRRQRDSEHQQTPQDATGPADAVVGDSEFGLYKPRTRETRAAFERLLAVLMAILGSQPRDIVLGAADEVLAIVKNGEWTAPRKQAETRKLLGSGLDDARFRDLLRACEGINDFSAADLVEDSGAAPGPEEEVGVAVVFDDSDDSSEDDGNLSVIADEEDEEDEDGEDGQADAGAGDRVPAASSDSDGGESASDSDREERLASTTTTTKKKKKEKKVSKSQKTGAARTEGLGAHEIDAYWIQRQLARWYSDANEAQSLAAETLRALGEPDERACENQLVTLLGFDKFDLIKQLLLNKRKLWYCVRLKQAQGPEARAAIQAEMAKDEAPGGGQAVLDELEGRAAAGAGQAAAGQAGRRGDGKVSVTDADERGTSATPAPPSGPVGRAPTRLDLAGLAFSAGDHTMSRSQTVKLPKGAWRKQSKGFEEVHVPPPAARPFAADEKLRAVSEMPPFTHGAFSKMTSLNRVQSRIYEAALNEDFNLLVCAPTGAGKTNVAVLTVLHEMGKFLDAHGQVDQARMKEGMKIVYVAPMKALVQEVVTNFSQRLGPAYGMVVRELSGDQQLSRAEIAETQVIVTTPEKWDIVTRKSGERAFTQLVRLVIIDEIHLLHNERGAVLEAIVARTVRQQELTQQRVRIVGISATLPNYKDVAAFCRVPLDRGLFFFDNSFRPVPLQQQYIGLTERKPLKRFHRSNEVCYDKITGALRRNPDDQVLVFVHSRKETTMSARALRDLAEERGEPEVFVNQAKPETKEVLQGEVDESVRSADLKELLPLGLAIHHAGMTRSDRNLVEDLFKQGYIKALVCTATLAWGVNLPAHSVIIKGTQVYNPEKGRWTELSQLDILQMLGRAGRPQFDTEGEGIIITTHSELQYYLSLMNEQLPIESQLIRRLADTLNAEIAMGSVQTLLEAARWIGYTYLYIRMLRNPQAYGVGVDELAADKTLLQRRLDLAHSAAILLDKAQLVRYDRRSGFLQGTPLGRIASHYYVTFDSMERFNEFLRPTMTDVDLFRAVSLAKEFSNLVVRDEEKLELVQLADRAPIPIKESADEPSAKVNLLLQAFISGLRLDGYAMACDLVFVQQSAARLTRALFEVCLARGWPLLALRCLDLANMTGHRIWPSQLPLRQLQAPALQADVLRRLERHALSVERLFALSPEELGELGGGGIKQGQALHRIVHCFPRVELSAQVQPITRSTLRVELTITPDFEFDAALYGTRALAFWVIVEDGDGERILHHEMLVLDKAGSEQEHETHFTVPLSNPLPPQYFCKVVCDRFMHAVTTLPISFGKLVLPDRFAPPTQLLDLQPLLTARAGAEAAAAIGGPAEGRNFVQRAFKELFASRFDTFNAIQTQVFRPLVASDDNALLAAPCGSGKTACIEMAIVRALAASATAKCVYVAPMDQVCRLRFAEWSASFGRALGRTVVLLSGDTESDLRLLGAAHLAIATPRVWDNVSRRWKQRKAVRAVTLFVADELHMLSRYQVLEVVVSRMRLMSSAARTETRILGVAASVANGADLAAWIGAPEDARFCFAPSSRPNRLEVELRGFEQAHVGTRLLAMARPAFDHVSRAAREGKSSIVFVPSARQAAVTAVDMVTFAAAAKALEADKTENGEPVEALFVKPGQSEALARHAAGLQDATVRQTLELGVGILREGLSAGDRATVETCFEAGMLRVLVVSHGCCWDLSRSADLVVVQGTTRYDGALGTHVDYAMAELMQMIGRATTRGDVARCVVLCHAYRKSFFKQFIHEAVPVESHLNMDLADHLCAEVAAEVVRNKQDAVDNLTWTFFYRRLSKNPNYYNLLGTGTDLLSDYLSELVENTLVELQESKCVVVHDNEMDVSALNLGIIASYYYISYATIKLFAANLHGQAKLRRVLDVLVSAEEFEEVPVRQGEGRVLAALAKRVKVPLTDPDFGEARTKAHILLQLHFSRRKLSQEQRKDLNSILEQCVRLLQAMVDIMASNSWLRPALAAMELSQMIVQARWNTDSPLLQVPHFDEAVVARCHDAGVRGVLEIGELEDRAPQVLQLPEAQLEEAAAFCNDYPNLEVALQVQKPAEVRAGEPVRLVVALKRIDEDEEDEGEGEGEGGKVEDGAGAQPAKRPREAPAKTYGKVMAQFYPAPKLEGYWLVVGDPEKDRLACIKRLSLAKERRVTLEFDAPSEVGKRQLKLYLMCDAVMGADQVHEFALDVQEGAGDDDSSSGSSSDSSDSSSSAEGEE